jgi:biopolymer transport protein TolR
MSLPPSGERGEELRAARRDHVTPIVDVRLVLLVIFMVAAPLLTVGVRINLPETSAAQVTEPQPPPVVSINADGETFIGDNSAAGDDLKTQLSTLVAQDPTCIVYVRGDRGIQYGTLTDLLGLVNTGLCEGVAVRQDFEIAVMPQ